MGDLLRRPRRPLDDGRGLRRAAARGRPGRRRAHAPRGRVRRATPAASSARACSRACGSRCSSLWSWEEVPAIPPELILLPPRAPLSIYSFGCWARQTIVALSVCSRAPADDDGAVRDRRAADRRRARAPPPTPWSRAFELLDRGAAPLRAAAGRAAAPPRAAHGRALDRRAPGARRLVGRDPAAVGLVDRSALRALGYRARPSGARARLRRARQLHGRGRARAGGSRRASRRSGTRRSALIALLDAGLAAGRRRGRRAARAGSPTARCRIRGDWAVRRPDIPTGGFPFEFANDNYPDVDDTAVVVLALRARGRATTVRGAARARPRVGARDAERGRRLGRVRRRQHERAAAEAAVLRLRRGHRPAERRRHRAHGRAARARGARLERGDARAGIDYLLREQERGRLVVRPLGREPRLRHRRRRAGARGVRHARPPQRARARSRGSTGCRTPTAASARTCAPTASPSWRGRGESTASQTAWALLALRRRRRRRASPSSAPCAGSSRRSGRDGGWDEPYYTGTGFPGDFYFNYHLYRQVFPVMALGRILGGRALTRPCSSWRRSASSRRCCAAPGWHVLRTGMGPARARIAAARGARGRGATRWRSPASAPPSRRRSRPGDVVCATELRARRRRPGRRCRGAPPRRGAPPARPARAPRAASSRPTTSPRRPSGGALEGSGALAVDMESAWLAEARGRPAARGRARRRRRRPAAASPTRACSSPASRALATLRRASAGARRVGRREPRVAATAGARVPTRSRQTAAR